MESTTRKTKREVKFEISAGGVVFRRIKNSKEKFMFLLIKDSYGRWALPKGKIEKKETPEETAIREIGEETGIFDLKIIDKLDTIQYFFRFKGQPISKTVHNFLLETIQEELKPNYEIQGAKWLSKEEALNTIAYSNTKEIIKKAINKLEGIKNAN